MCVCARAVYVIAVRMYREIFHVSRAIVFIPVDVAHFAKGANRSKHNDNDADVEWSVLLMSSTEFIFGAQFN